MSLLVLVWSVLVGASEAVLSSLLVRQVVAVDCVTMMLVVL